MVSAADTGPAAKDKIAMPAKIKQILLNVIAASFCKTSVIWFIVKGVTHHITHWRTSLMLTSFSIHNRFRPIGLLFLRYGFH